ncbi:MAG: ABC transporter ATP-binding protein [Firmicutes bacterium]|nr:ABC transporter ATP-binding protein [Bacillota bacterium]
MENLLEIKDLRCDLMSTKGIVYALGGVTLDIRKGEILGVVGESGCGKSMTAKSILRLHNKQRSRLSGQILFEGQDLVKCTERQMQKIRGDRISMIFQDPTSSLNPLLTIGEQISETFLLHNKITKAEAKARTLELLAKVGIQPPEKRFDQYPFELSGGLQQRVMIAIAIACDPALLIADEPTTALDVTIQAQILDLLKDLQRDMGMSILLITHNFGLIAEICDRVAVMYAGKIVEVADTQTIFDHPRHPYSKALIESIPQPGSEGEYLMTIPGSPPEMFNDNRFCLFRDRCSFRTEACDKLPPMEECESGHFVACWNKQ